MKTSLIISSRSDIALACAHEFIKQARASKSVIEKMYPNFHHSKKFQSLQSERLGL